MWLDFIDKKMDRSLSDWKLFHSKYAIQMQVITSQLKNSTLAQELAEVALRGKMSEQIKRWVKDELTNSSVLTNLDKNCEA
jgi:hypothetical protein